MSEILRRLPAVHRLMDSPSLRTALERWGHTALREACRTALDEARGRIRSGADVSMNDLEAAVRSHLTEVESDAYGAVINATGVLLHTNLGRAPALSGLSDALDGYLALEFDLATGRRGQRLSPLKDRITRVCGGESAVMVNNNAGALLLILSALAPGRDVIVSRSQLIEIGGSFRLPEVMEAAGCRLVEVGCTNRTHLEDYRAAISDDTGAILVAHQSNFRIVGFTAAPSTAELARLAHEHDLPLIVDQGSGCLHDLRRWGLPHEETVGEILEAGADVVCFSGDKLLGGPQAGVIVGSERRVGPLARHPLYRALRPDKFSLVAMDRVLRTHQADRLDEIPLYAMLNAPVETLRQRAARLGRRLRTEGVEARGRATAATLGGGTTPEETLPSYGLELPGGRTVLDALRYAEPPIVGRMENDRVILDLRTVFPDQDRRLADGIVRSTIGAAD